MGSGVYRLAHRRTVLSRGRVGGERSSRARHRQAQVRRRGQRVRRDLTRAVEALGDGPSGRLDRVLYPVPDSDGGGVPRPDLHPPTTTSSTTSRSSPAPRTGVLVNCAWRDGAAYNGFYLSHDGGQTFARVNPKGAQPTRRRQRPFAYSDTARLYALVESRRKIPTRPRLRSAACSSRPNGASPDRGQDCIAARAGHPGLRAEKRGLLPTGHAGLVQQLHRGRPDDPDTSSWASRRFTRPRTADRTGRRLARGLELLLPLLDPGPRAEHLPDDDPPGPALDGDRQRPRLRRQRRRRLPPPARGEGEHERQRHRLGEPQRELRTLQYYSVASATCPAASPSPAASRTTVARCCSPRILGRRRHDGLALRR